MAEGSETLEQLEERQEQEESELDEKAKAHLEAVQASGAKGKKFKLALEAAEREAEQWRYDLAVRHREEREALEEQNGSGAAAEGSEGRNEEATPKDGAGSPKLTPEQEEAERIQRKKDKALKKRQGRAAKEFERALELEAERHAAGPSRRAVELAAITKKLANLKPPLKVLEVAGDGHCLYRAVADQIRRVRPDLHTWQKMPEAAHEEMRALCAVSLQARRATYEPFAELKDKEDFNAYCRRVEHSADWGGQLELRAIADELGAKIVVHRADEEPLVLGEGRGAPLQVTYHHYWYALGEHYNSAVAVDQS